MMCSTLYVCNHEAATSIQTLHVSARSIVQDFIAMRQQRITEIRILLMYYTIFLFCKAYKQCDIHFEKAFSAEQVSVTIL